MHFQNKMILLYLAFVAQQRGMVRPADEVTLPPVVYAKVNKPGINRDENNLDLVEG